MMNWLEWAINGNGRWMPTVQCLGNDPWIIYPTIALNLGVVFGYLVIAKHWFGQLRTNISAESRSALKNLMYVFLFCGITGYGFRIILFYVPAWPVYLFALLLLNGLTWWYISRLSAMRVMFHQMRETKSSLHRVEDIVKSAETGSDTTMLMAQIKSAISRTSQSIDELGGRAK